MLLTLPIQFHLCRYRCRIFIRGLNAGSLILLNLISFGHDSANNSYSLGGVVLNRVYDVCDLRVRITSDFKPSLHYKGFPKVLSFA